MGPLTPGVVINNPFRKILIHFLIKMGHSEFGNSPLQPTISGLQLIVHERLCNPKW